MFSYEKLLELYDYYSIVILPVYFIALLISWKNINFRYLISILILVEAFDSSTYLYIVPFGSIYYLWGVFICTLFIIPVMGRRLIANKLEKKLDFFRKANENYHFTKQEGGLLSLYFITAISFIVTFIEVNLFKFNLIGSVPFRLHIYGPSHLLISFFELFLVISMVLGKNRSSKEERHRFA